MSLFEIITNRIGESYVRAYSWAENEEQAKTLFRAANPDESYEIRGVVKLFDCDAEPFCTLHSDSGWRTVEYA